MTRYTIGTGARVVMARLCLVLVVGLCLPGCVAVKEAVWLRKYRAAGGYEGEDTEMRRRGDGEMWKRKATGQQNY